jgi:hypothetical protein
MSTTTPISLGSAILATDHVAKDGQKIRWMFRAKPTHGSDSGWRVFSGLESQDYVDDPDNLRWYRAETIFEIDPTIRPYLAATVGAAFEWDADAQVFRPVHDFDTTES